MFIGRMEPSYRRTDLGGIRHLVSVRHGAPVLSWLLQRNILKFRVARILHLAGGSGGIARDIARSNYCREYKFISAGLILQQFKDRERDLDFAIGRNVGDRLGKDVGTLLVKQGGGVSGGAGGVEDLARLFAFLDYSLDFTLAHLHGHAIYRAVMRQGKDIDGLYSVGQDVLKFLRDHNTGH